MLAPGASLRPRCAERRGALPKWGFRPLPGSRRISRAFTLSHSETSRREARSAQVRGKAAQASGYHFRYRTRPTCSHSSLRLWYSKASLAACRCSNKPSCACTCSNSAEISGATSSRKAAKGILPTSRPEPLKEAPPAGLCQMGLAVPGKKSSLMFISSGRVHLTSAYRGSSFILSRRPFASAPRAPATAPSSRPAAWSKSITACSHLVSQAFSRNLSSTPSRSQPEASRLSRNSLADSSAVSASARAGSNQPKT
mmetsp:Transcript_116465/g.340737  ORF Transcript_116465/g.340737 Transcript_116465/m.340737 type:complete len:255 (-) Transcript_116465:10-774(-)